MTTKDKRVDGVLWTRTQGGKIEGADEPTEPLVHPFISPEFLFSKVIAMVATPISF